MSPVEVLIFKDFFVDALNSTSPVEQVISTASNVNFFGTVVSAVSALTEREVYSPAGI